ncbi:Hypothetical protein I596_3797 [Dokdonella koreensis DS-123]|uniref:Uncharacterized protein n=1 Tax=Dokdonella koreensis DS-123 TaxID=1300342 RepID=A0A167HBN5_9GAMM|nr:Hypothetical protein I596_3797 [Dokdonella koreensis DS-123]
MRDHRTRRLDREHPGPAPVRPSRNRLPARSRKGPLVPTNVPAAGRAF